MAQFGQGVLLLYVVVVFVVGMAAAYAAFIGDRDSRMTWAGMLLGASGATAIWVLALYGTWK